MVRQSIAKRSESGPLPSENCLQDTLLIWDSPEDVLLKDCFSRRCLQSPCFSRATSFQCMCQGMRCPSSLGLPGACSLTHVQSLGRRFLCAPRTYLLCCTLRHGFRTHRQAALRGLHIQLGTCTLDTAERDPKRETGGQRDHIPDSSVWWVFRNRPEWIISAIRRALP